MLVRIITLYFQAMTQIYAELVSKVFDNQKMINDWADIVEQGLVAEFDKSGEVRAGFFMLMGTYEPKEWRYKSIRNFELNDETLKLLVAQNYVHGCPLMASVFAVMLESLDIEGKPQTAMLLTLQTPLKRICSMYIVQEVEGKPKLIYDGFLTQFASLPKTIQRFTYLLDSGATPTLS